MQHPFFSVIIPTYNRKQFLKIALASILAQTFNDYEVIVIDDGSSDGTREMLEGRGAWNPPSPRLQRTGVGRGEKIKYIYQENKGPAAARNLGIKNAKGKFICFLDTDDRFREDKLKVTYDYIKNHPQYKIFHTEEIWYRKGSLLTQKIYHKKPTGWVFENAVRMCSISISTAAIEKNIFNEVGLFDESMPACEDYDFWLRVTNKYKVLLIPYYLTIKEGGHPDQQSFKYPAMDTFRIYALKKMLETKTLSGDNFKIAAGELRKKCEIFIKGALKRGKIKEAKYHRTLIEKFST
ncbi:MAG: glycosyltransferase family 2 protein [Candidatus Omnitrophica bacterium]|jgi:glycosyltransferase involved in cell wall biosynthesis|nr:glycosyltransferase family 2 protein [Candidatus Omnitrophota bacterium]